mmetsp:Transcript_5554/g.20244  ORF Transcript_5554/g.20244 Transcript_5554/m.20244 type:complete len:114 (+) Transcript_5554:1003-1344(+)
MYCGARAGERGRFPSIRFDRSSLGKSSSLTTADGTGRGESTWSCPDAVLLALEHSGSVILCELDLDSFRLRHSNVTHGGPRLARLEKSVCAIWLWNAFKFLQAFQRYQLGHRV